MRQAEIITRDDSVAVNEPRANVRSNDFHRQNLLFMSLCTATVAACKQSHPGKPTEPFVVNRLNFSRAESRCISAVL